MNELQSTLKQLERELCKFQVSGTAAIIMGEALKLLLRAEMLAAEVKEEVQDAAAEDEV